MLHLPVASWRSARDADITYGCTRSSSSALENWCLVVSSRERPRGQAVKKLSFDVHVGEAVGIVGSNGSGSRPFSVAIAGVQSLAGG